MKNQVDFRVDFGLKAVAEVQRTASGLPKYTWYMEKVSQFLETNNSPMSKTKILAGVKRNERLTSTAISTLIEQGYANITNGPRGSHLISFVKPYQEDLDKPIDDPAINPF